MPAKKHLRLFLIAIVLGAFATSGYVQSACKSIIHLAKSYSNADNTKDHSALAAIFKAGADWVDDEDKTTNGAELTGADYARGFSATG